MVIEAFLIILICAVLVAGSYYAAHYVVSLRHNRDMLADEMKRANDHIVDLEAHIIALEAQVDRQQTRDPTDKTGWSDFSTR